MLKLICLFVAVLFTIVNIVGLGFKNPIPPINFILQSAGITGFIYLQWLI